MRQLRRLLSVLVMAVTIVGMSVTAFAQEDVVKGGSGSLTIANASKGVVYSVYKVFDAKVNADGTSVAYTKRILLIIHILRKIQQGMYLQKRKLIDQSQKNNYPKVQLNGLRRIVQKYRV